MITVAYTAPLVQSQALIMDSLDSPFTIEINGSPVSNIPDNAGLPVQANVGPDAAVFTLKNGRLQCGDRVLGRALTEDRSMLPKRILWFEGTSCSDKIQPVTAQPEGKSYQLIFAGMYLGRRPFFRCCARVELAV
jgi:hypothetical protein